MTGGAFKNSSNLLSRRREIEEFEKTVAENAQTGKRKKMKKLRSVMMDMETVSVK